MNYPTTNEQILEAFASASTIKALLSAVLEEMGKIQMATIGDDDVGCWGYEVRSIADDVDFVRHLQHRANMRVESFQALATSRVRRTTDEKANP